MLQSTAPRVTIGCRTRVYFRGIYLRNRLRIWLMGMGIIALVMFTFTLRRRSQTSTRVEQLCEAVLQILAEQDGLHRRDPTLPNSISIHQIRDALFFKASNRTRNRLWPLVRDRFVCTAEGTHQFVGLQGHQSEQQCEGNCNEHQG